MEACCQDGVDDVNDETMSGMFAKPEAQSITDRERITHVVHTVNAHEAHLNTYLLIVVVVVLTVFVLSIAAVLLLISSLSL